jgi:23S rRNA (uracil1939-C5)-methyltransferase
MSYGPHAVARSEGKVVFVRGAAPEETVDATVHEDHGRFAFADLIGVVEPSAARRSPPCPYLPRCGGCPWQHLRYGAQLTAKAAVVREHLRRIGGLDVTVEPVAPSPSEFGTRSRLKLRVQERTIGFLAGGAHDLVPVDTCLLAAPALAAAMPLAAELVRRLETSAQRIELVLAEPTGSRVVLVAQCEGGWVAGDDAACRALAARANVGGVVLAGRGWRHVWGDDRVTIAPEPDLALSLRAGTFSQVNPAANQMLVATVLRLAAARGGLRVIDLYAGAGNLSLPLARRGATVWAVEQQPQAVRDGRANAKRLGLTQCRFLHRRAAPAIASFAARRESVDLVVLDPPRNGAADVIAPLLRLAPQRLVYVSCNPSSLARDLKLLGTRYRLDCVQPLDLFPHSYHVETVAAATLAC